LILPFFNYQSNANIALKTTLPGVKFTPGA
jgi:hypothetical protein